ncbi:MAG: hypothetical protein GC178_03470 [Flavobacteriales bacterium]|nr:hypothetical protein [Flavobacteriales bacterium]
MIDHEPIFRDSVLNQRLFEEGYITLPFLNMKEIDQLKELFWEHHSQDEVEGLYVSAHFKNDAQIHQISDAIQQIFKRAINEHIENGMTLGGTFISKPPHQTEPLQPHQDWSIVDESRYRSFTIWVPLDDVSEENGCMYVLPKSHEYVRGYRHISIDSVFGKIYDTVWKHMKPVHLKAGEAIVFDHALGHASKPNTTDKVRIAATHSLISKDPEMRFYWNNDGVVEEYVGENDFYNTPEAKVGPGTLRKVRTLDFKPQQLNDEEFFTLACIEERPAEQFASKEKQGIVNWFRRMLN